MGGRGAGGGGAWQLCPAALPSPGFTEEEAGCPVLRDLPLSTQLSVQPEQGAGGSSHGSGRLCSPTLRREQPLLGSHCNFM